MAARHCAGAPARSGFRLSSGLCAIALLQGGIVPAASAAVIDQAALVLDAPATAACGFRRDRLEDTAKAAFKESYIEPQEDGRAPVLVSVRVQVDSLPVRHGACLAIYELDFAVPTHFVWPVNGLTYNVPGVFCHRLGHTIAYRLRDDDDFSRDLRRAIRDCSTEILNLNHLP